MVGTVPVPLEFVRHPRARRYVLRVTPQGAARVTVPRGGSVAEGRRFAESQVVWLERQLRRRQEGALRPTGWFVGSRILFRGASVALTAASFDGMPVVRFGDQMVRVPHFTADVRSRMERHLWGLARRELPGCVWALATRHGFTVRGVTVRNQKSRWGSCSRRGSVSLNWRLIQTPDFVRDYIILHELTHLREMNHSHRFWRAVAAVCPDYREAERWLRTHSSLLR